MTTTMPQGFPLYAVWHAPDDGFPTGLVVGWQYQPGTGEWWPIAVAGGGQYDGEHCAPAQLLQPSYAVDLYTSREDVEEARTTMVEESNAARRRAASR